jgi:hypothetical protein
MTPKQQLTPIPAHIEIKRCPPGRARWAGLPGEFAGGCSFMDSRADPTIVYPGTYYSVGCSGSYLPRGKG